MPAPTRDSDLWGLELGFWDLQSVPVAQPDRASDFGSEGWGFESLQARISCEILDGVVLDGRE
jgi:hypothetical protein